MSDADWDRLVAWLRDTFAAEGRVLVSSTRREWRVGNLRVTHGPTEDGALLVAVAAVGAFVLVARPDAPNLGAAAVAGAAGLVTLLVGALRLPVWASTRTRQFDSLADFARRLVGP